eukprot:CAMPEP_0170081342 /NCGR_PEP_ID=MMETSP0019_2-20121128/17231_1 /TAXON_ID=98059 /ORGANISM="Dinobryon sp., Strain UTEXLB2267" /LENGTH=442 /DNA_ID=CAMNT_0010295719 /DNA_START=15 /DNA_END=1343 /DNA_ORIENTATION=+
MILDSESLGKMQKSTISLAKALEFSTDARVICHARHPNGLLHANKAWTLLTKYEQHEIEGKNLSCLHGPLTDKDRIKQMMHDVMFSGFGLTEVISYDKYDVPFVCKISIQPVISQNCYGEYLITHYMGVLEKKVGEYVGFCDKDGKLKHELQPLIFLSKEEEEAYDWVINADKQLDLSPARLCDDEFDECDEDATSFSRSQRRKQLAQLSNSNNKHLRKRNAKRCHNQQQVLFSNHYVDYDDSEEDKIMDKRDTRPRRRPKHDKAPNIIEAASSPSFVYRIDAIEFLPPLSTSNSPLESAAESDDPPATYDLSHLMDSMSATTVEGDEEEMGARTDSRKRPSSDLDADLSHSSSSVCQTLFAGQRLRNICVDSCKEKRLRLDSKWSRSRLNCLLSVASRQEDGGITDASMHSINTSSMDFIDSIRHHNNTVRSGQGGLMEHE